jgi:hypothetical protein
MGFVQNLSLSQLVKNRNRLAFVVWEIFQKNWEGIAEILTFFGFCATVFSSIAAPRNSLIVSKLWDDPPLQTTFMVFFILGSEAEILTIEILEKIPKNFFVFRPCQALSNKPPSVRKNNISPSLPLGSVGVVPHNVNLHLSRGGGHPNRP